MTDEILPSPDADRNQGLSEALIPLEDGRHVLMQNQRVPVDGRSYLVGQGQVLMVCRAYRVDSPEGFVALVPEPGPVGLAHDRLILFPVVDPPKRTGPASAHPSSQHINQSFQS